MNGSTSWEAPVRAGPTKSRNYTMKTFIIWNTLLHLFCRIRPKLANWLKIRWLRFCKNSPYEVMFITDYDQADWCVYWSKLGKGVAVCLWAACWSVSMQIRFQYPKPRRLIWWSYVKTKLFPKNIDPFWTVVYSRLYQRHGSRNSRRWWHRFRRRPRLILSELHFDSNEIDSVVINVVW